MEIFEVITENNSDFTDSDIEVSEGECDLQKRKESVEVGNLVSGLSTSFTPFQMTTILV